MGYILKIIMSNITQYLHRFIFIVPIANVPAVVAWFQTNIGPNSVSNDFGPPLNPSGLSTDPTTHNWISGAFTDGEAKAILAMLCQNSSAKLSPVAASWDSLTQTDKINWVNKTVQPDISTGGFGVYTVLNDNTGSWDDVNAILAKNGLQIKANSPVGK